MELQKLDQMEKNPHRKNGVINKKLVYKVCTIALITSGYDFATKGRVFLRVV
ncbi:hypothetical protein [Virgibacillus necropolis]|uniref:hypothetical protein n=1 Tax=Virgibacillus necropolis TaxID=163877 RepID=UPI00137479E2|nr:hypothetical protein [Virgibacillus necropolis]